MDKDFESFQQKHKHLCIKKSTKTKIKNLLERGDKLYITTPLAFWKVSLTNNQLKLQHKWRNKDWHLQKNTPKNLFDILTYIYDHDYNYNSYPGEDWMRLTPMHCLDKRITGRILSSNGEPLHINLQDKIMINLLSNNGDVEWSVKPQMSGFYHLDILNRDYDNNYTVELTISDTHIKQYVYTEVQGEKSDNCDFFIPSGSLFITNCSKPVTLHNDHGMEFSNWKKSGLEKGEYIESVKVIQMGGGITEQVISHRWHYGTKDDYQYRNLPIGQYMLNLDGNNKNVEIKKGKAVYVHLN